MKKTIKITAISGSIRKNSYNTLLLEAIKDLAPENIEISVFTIKDIPMFNEDVESKGIPDVVQKLAVEIKESDAIILATPEYNGATTGALLNTLEWLSRGSVGTPAANKPVGIVGATVGQSGTIRAQQFLKTYALALNMFVFNKPVVRVTHSGDKFDDNGKLTDERTQNSITTFVDYLYQFTNKLKN